MNELIFSNFEIDFQKNHKFNGVPTLFLTVSNCTYECIKDGKLCNHSDSSNNKFTVDDAKKFIEQNNQIKHIFIKGGEPLIYKKQLEQFLTDIYHNDLIVTICTKGTLPILNPLNPNYKVYMYIVDLSDKNIPQAGDKIIKNNKEFIYGTNDIEKMKQFNINIIRDICVYSSDYLLCFRAAPEQILEKSQNVINKILDTQDEFTINFLNKYNPKNNIVFSSRNNEEKEQIKEICIKHGIIFNNN